MYNLYSVSLKLSPFVDCYWESDFAGATNGVYQELFVAQLHPNIIINLSDSYLRNNTTVFRSSVNTINTAPIHFTHQTSNQLFGIRFKPAGLNMFTSLGMHELVDASIGLQEIFGDEAFGLETSLFQSTNVYERIEATEQFLLNKLEIRNLTKYIFSVNVQENVSKYFDKPNCITEIAENLNTTQRTLDRNFKQILGLSPKKLHRVIRFQKVYEALHSPQYKNKLFDFYDFGYYDQAHFGKEFKEFVGMNFQEYLQSPHFVQNLQDNHYSD
jgi:AraC-like DNA-binding protein